MEGRSEAATRLAHVRFHDLLKDGIGKEGSGTPQWPQRPQRPLTKTEPGRLCACTLQRSTSHARKQQLANMQVRPVEPAAADTDTTRLLDGCRRLTENGPKPWSGRRIVLKTAYSYGRDLLHIQPTKSNDTSRCQLAMFSHLEALCN
ncbi:uncharacterized protein SPSK_08057 [Sporothrix schenckii 1099-18]|uniref:Uncharacterized protein n=1 Tax=Sporothrix schenckii 1099-18 TaxID=1397361 RepID=A0A0F2MEI4_SPOSC|nr:uncharacterized protein SPSK_08057 [Sporothrix schenckii 1099-18]KJR88037.1 hypothetical protein SPSK_08057 [Sporothrix schenckii 1099-18]